MLKRLVVLVVGAALVAGCGGGGSASDDTEPTKAAPRSYTIAELAAALPGKDDVAGVSGVEYTCPKRKDRCPAPDEGERVGVALTIVPAGDNPADAEKAANKSLFGNSTSLSAWRHESPSKAAKSLAESLATDKKFNGAYRVKQKGDPKTGATPAEKGKGTLKTLQIGSWKGYSLGRHGSMTFQGTSESRLIATAEVVRGNVTASIYLNVQGDGRPADFADKLARKVLGDYLKRLG